MRPPYTKPHHHRFELKQGSDDRKVGVVRQPGSHGLARQPVRCGLCDASIDIGNGELKLDQPEGPCGHRGRGPGWISQGVKRKRTVGGQEDHQQ